VRKSQLEDADAGDFAGVLLFGAQKSDIKGDFRGAGLSRYHALRAMEDGNEAS